MAKRRKAAVKKKSGPTKKKRGASRASWRGSVTFGLVSFAAEAVNAFDRAESDIHFHQLHATCHSRIHYQKVCPVHGEVSNDEIVSGYEVSKDKYVEIDPEELDALRPARERALNIDSFVAPDTIDPIYLDGRMYYLLPAKGAEESYGVMVEAMRREDRVAVGKIILSGKEQIVMVRVYEGLLQMAMLNYDEEIKSPEKLASTIKKPRQVARQVRLAQTLIRNWFQEEFDFTKYDDDYRERVQDLIDAKVKGKEATAPDADEEEPEVINLMEALKRSISKEARPTKPRRKKRKLA